MRKASKIDYGYNSTFPCRLRKIMDDNKTTQATLANECGVERQSVAQWRDGNTRPDILSLKKIAEFYNISTDYLLGLSEAPTQDVELKAVCEYTGLSQKAIEKIIEVRKEEQIEEFESTLGTFSAIIENENFWRIVLQLNSATDYIEFLNTNPTHMMEMAINRLNGQEIISNENRKILSFINLNGLGPLFKQELAETIWQLFDEVVKQEDAKES